MSDTPRTYAEIHSKDPCFSRNVVTVDANFACQLEMELNAANEMVKRLKKAGDDIFLLAQKHAPEYWLDTQTAFNNWKQAKEAKL